VVEAPLRNARRSIDFAIGIASSGWSRQGW